MSEEKYTIELVLKSARRTLTTVQYPQIDYGEAITIETIIMDALLKAGYDKAKLMGEDVSFLADRFGDKAVSKK